MRKSNDFRGIRVRNMTGQFVDPEWLCECLGIETETPGRDPVGDYWIPIQDVSVDMLLTSDGQDTEEILVKALDNNEFDAFVREAKLELIAKLSNDDLEELDDDEPAPYYVTFPEKVDEEHRLDEVRKLKKTKRTSAKSADRDLKDFCLFMGDAPPRHIYVEERRVPRRGHRRGYKPVDDRQLGRRLNKDKFFDLYITEEDELAQMSDEEFAEKFPPRGYEALFEDDNLEAIEIAEEERELDHEVWLYQFEELATLELPYLDWLETPPSWESRDSQRIEESETSFLLIHEQLMLEAEREKLALKQSEKDWGDTRHRKPRWRTKRRQARLASPRRRRPTALSI